MSTEFMRLYRELEKITPSTAYDEGRLVRQRNDVMHRLGHKGVGSTQKYTKGSKWHGIKARENAHEARQEALLGNAKEKAQLRMQVHAAVHNVEHLNGLARELSKFVDAKKNVPGGLMRRLVGNDAMRKKAPAGEEKDAPVSSWSVTTLPREAREKPKDFSANSWSTEERAQLNRIYLEMPKPTVMTKLDSWRIFYENVGVRFIAFHPHRTLEEAVAKLEDMITRRVMKEVGEADYWKDVASPGKKSSVSVEQSQPAGSASLHGRHGAGSSVLTGASNHGGCNRVPLTLTVPGGSQMLSRAGSSVASGR